MKASLNCIILFVRDVDNLKKFYTGHFNLELIEEIKSEWVLLKAGMCELALHKFGAGYLNADPPAGATSNTKIVFETGEDIFALHKKLAESSVTLKEIKTWDNYPYWVCDGEDPEGNVFQLRMKK